MKLMLLLATTLAALGSPLQAEAQEGQSVWRCGADGRSYSATPCAEGRKLASADPRPDTDVKAAQDMAQRERLLGQNLAKERQHREAAVRPGDGLAGIGGGTAQATQAVKPAAASKKQRRSPKHRLALQPGDDGIWQAVGPATRRKKG
jgi:hypothetical protein